MCRQHLLKPTEVDVNLKVSEVSAPGWITITRHFHFVWCNIAAIKMWHVAFKYFTQYESDIALMKHSNRQMQNIWDILRQSEKMKLRKRNFWRIVKTFLWLKWIIQSDAQKCTNSHTQSQTSKQQFPIILHLSGNMGSKQSWVIADKH